jgi:hypothetical protein
MTLTLHYIADTLKFKAHHEDAHISLSAANKFLVDHAISVYTNATTASSGPWKSISSTPLAQLVWDCKKALPGVKKGMERFRVVDLKGQVD